MNVKYKCTINDSIVRITYGSITGTFALWLVLMKPPDWDYACLKISGTYVRAYVVFFSLFDFSRRKEKENCYAENISIYNLSPLAICLRPKSRGRLCDPAKLSDSFSFDMRAISRPIGRRECLQPGFRVPTSCFASPSCTATCRRASTARCRGRKRFQLRYVSHTRDRTRGPYFYAIQRVCEETPVEILLPRYNP